MVINIYCSEVKKGIHHLDDIRDCISNDDIVKYIKSSYGASLELKNGTIYNVICALDSVRGKKCDFAHIDTNLGQDIIDCIIYPTIIYSNLHTQQVKYF